jgi:glycosyltransferase involved in cell wall biosynthesis
LPVEVIVVDDGSDDGTLEWLKESETKYPFKLTVISRKHAGYRLASLNNMGAQKANTSRILFTNADVLHCYESVKYHAELDGSTVGAGMVKGIARDDSMIKFIMSRGLDKLPLAGRSNEGFLNLDPAKDQAGVWGGNLSVPSVPFYDIGGYDESYAGWGGEDADMVGRLVEKGAGVEWLTDSTGFHMKHAFRDYHYESKGSKKYMAGKVDKEK